MPRTFELVRHADLSGVSGTGVVAEGCVFTDGSVALRWRGDNPATAVWPDLDSVLAVHGHHGATEVNWLDAIDRSAFRAPNLPTLPSVQEASVSVEEVAVEDVAVEAEPEWVDVVDPAPLGHHRGEDIWGDLLSGRPSHGFRPSTPAGSFVGEPSPRARGRHFRS
ncbi:hypothetical protein OG394_12200 [Kribbella sp. NBC_01245]|uniref:hypothetical protein n=1 Tax=Kribbella sp. NBC_01245 TaxID=2903578 RepID=UPI002E2BC472|nr:hypothetical protein [Kribbella sp. NBC_01245]